MLAQASVDQRKIRVLIVDDSASVRATLSDILTSDPGIEIMATATDPYAAVERLKMEVPDVIFLDVEMPRMDGITFLRKLMSQRPVPVVICSSQAEAGSSTFLEALEAGAVEVVSKPRIDTAQWLQESRDRICHAARAAAHAKLGGRHKPAPPLHVEAKLSADHIIPEVSFARLATQRLPHTDPVICIGASTGGTEAIKSVLLGVPADSPGIVIVQHMPEKFTHAFANRLNSLCAIEVKEAEHGDRVCAGRALIAPGGRHLALARRGATYTVEIIDGPPVTRHRPSVDVLFRSAAQSAGRNAVGVILTGMGDDGARGMLEMHHAGAATLAQDEATSVVFGMPKEAIGLGGVSKVAPLGRVAKTMLSLAQVAADAH